METVALNFTYSREEFIKAQRWFLAADKTAVRAAAIIYFVYLAVSVFFLGFSRFNVVSVIIFIIALIIAIAALLLYFYIPALKYRNAAKYHDSYEFSFSNENVRLKTKSVNSEISWSVFSGLWETDDFYYLIREPRAYTLIPKRTFTGGDDKKAFEEIVLSSMKYKKRSI